MLTFLSPVGFSDSESNQLMDGWIGPTVKSGKERGGGSGVGIGPLCPQQPALGLAGEPYV